MNVRDCMPCLWGCLFRRLVIAVLFSAACLGFGTAAWAQRPTAEELLGSVMDAAGAKNKDVQKAIDDFYLGKVEDARRELGVAAKTDPNLPPGDVVLALLLMRSNALFQARMALEKTVVDFPDDPDPYLFFGELALRESQYTDAELLFNRGGDLAAKFATKNEKRKKNLQARALGGRAAVAEFREKWDIADRLLKEAIELGSEVSGLKFRRARVLFQLAMSLPEKDKEKKESTFGECYTIFSSLYEEEKDEKKKPLRFEINMALLFEQNANRAGASSDFASRAKGLMAKAIERDGKNLNTRLAVAEWALQTGNTVEGKTHALEALKIDPTSIAAKLQLGLVYRYAKDFAKAEEMFAAVHQQAPSNPTALAQLPISMVEQTDENKRKRSSEFAELNLRSHADMREPVGREAAMTYAWVKFKLGEDNDAANAALQALNAGPVSADAAYYGAVILNKRGNKEEALRLLDQAIANTKFFPSKEDAEALRTKLKAAVPATPAGETKKP